MSTVVKVDVMPIVDIFSKRQARLRGEVPDVYSYDDVPRPLRVQIVHIIGDLLQRGRRGADPPGDELYQKVTDVLCREYGLLRLHGAPWQEDPVQELSAFILETSDHERVLDVAEVSTRCAEALRRSSSYCRDTSFNEHVDRAIDELNARFKEHGVGYQYEGGQLVRVDSDLLHVEAVKPALALLRTDGYSGPREEFLKAYEHYRHGRHEEALNEALKAFESTMKAICDSKEWDYDKGSPARKLVDVCLRNHLVEPFWQEQLTQLRGTLESGIATARNNLGAHGQGSQPRTVPRHIVAYVLHLTASTIVFLIESAGSQPAPQTGPERPPRVRT